MPELFDAILFSIIPLLIAIILHEISHGLVAYSLGDSTAKDAGRFKLHTHFDLYGSFLIPLGLFLAKSHFLIGYAKPVPVDPRNFKDPITDMALVAIAGPICNILLALLSAFIMQKFIPTSYFIQKFLVHFIVINLVLFFFNLIPIPPLDGSRILAAMLPVRYLDTFYSLENLGFFIIMGIEFVCQFVSRLIGTDIGIFSSFIKPAVYGSLKILLY